MLCKSFLHLSSGSRWFRCYYICYYLTLWLNQFVYIWRYSSVWLIRMIYLFVFHNQCYLPRSFAPMSGCCLAFICHCGNRYCKKYNFYEPDHFGRSLTSPKRALSHLDVVCVRSNVPRYEMLCHLLALYCFINNHERHAWLSSTAPWAGGRLNDRRYLIECEVVAARLKMDSHGANQSKIVCDVLGICPSFVNVFHLLSHILEVFWLSLKFYVVQFKLMIILLIK